MPNEEKVLKGLELYSKVCGGGARDSLINTELRYGDAYELIKSIPDKSVDLIMTDPPYLIESTKAGGKSDLAKSIQVMNDELRESEITQGIDLRILNDFIRVCKKPNIYIWCNHKQIPDYLDFFVTKEGLSFDIIIWNKTNAPPLFNNKYLTDKEYCLYFRKGAYCQPSNYEDAKTVFNQPINSYDKKRFAHPTIKPMNIIKTLIKNSTREGDVVLDPFAGSGTTLIASMDLGRNSIGFEISKKYYDMANNRIKGIGDNGDYSFFPM